MDPVFSMQWPEFLLANRLQELLGKKKGYSVFIPISRQEKAIDLAVIKKANGRSKTLTFQVKASKVFMAEPPKKKGTIRYQYNTWFNRFVVQPEADFFLLFGLYAPDLSRTRGHGSNWYKECTLLFSQEEMSSFMDSCFTVSGKPDRMFGFGFNKDKEIFQTRGDKDRKYTSYSSFLLEKRIDKLIDKLD